MDQAAAMEWGHKWGKFFGGDLEQVSLNGCSAGSESILWHMVLPTSWPYFNRAVTVGIGLNSAYEADLARAPTFSCFQFEEKNQQLFFKGLSGYNSPFFRFSRMFQTKTTPDLSIGYNIIQSIRLYVDRPNTLHQVSGWHLFDLKRQQTAYLRRFRIFCEKKFKNVWLIQYFSIIRYLSIK